MTNFWDLPKAVRERIYRLHLVQDLPVGRRDYFTSCNMPRGKHSKTMPCLLAASTKIEREAVHIYFGENTFKLSTPWYLNYWLDVV